MCGCGYDWLEDEEDEETEETEEAVEEIEEAAIPARVDEEVEVA